MTDEALKKLRHDLRTPLNQILGYAELLGEEADERGDPRTAADLGKIAAAARTLVGRVEALVGDPGAQSTRISSSSAPPEAESEALEAADEEGLVLVVDDDERNRDMLGRRLSRSGYRVLLADGGRAALEVVAETRPDLVLLDVMMPGMSGVEVLAELRRTWSPAELPVIMATARGDSSDVVAALRLGANDYVTKPLDFPVVLARVKTQLALLTADRKVKELAQELATRNRFIRSAFGRYLSDEVAVTVLESPEGLRLGGETRRVTILLSDLRGFTSVVEAHRAEDVVELLNHYLGVMAEVIHAHGGTIIEFLGDGILVVFGAPIHHGDDAARALACAIAMQQAMGRVDAFNRDKGLPSVEMGIAVNTGEVVVGNVGSDSRAKYGVVGAPVNLSSRIESLTVGGQVLASAATVTEAGAIVRVGRRRSVRVKGSIEPLEVYEIVGLEGSWGLELPLIEARPRPITPIPVRLLVLEGKLLGDEGYDATMTELCERGAVVTCAAHLDELTDVRVVLRDGAHAYAKVIGAKPDALQLRFTLVSQAAAAIFAHARA